MEALERFRFQASAVRKAPGRKTVSKPLKETKGTVSSSDYSAAALLPDLEEFPGDSEEPPGEHTKSLIVSRTAGSFSELEACEAPVLESAEPAEEGLHNTGGSRESADAGTPSEVLSAVVSPKPSKRPFAIGGSPERWKEVLDRIREMRKARDAPVDLFGTRQCVDSNADVETQRFQALVAAMISSQTKDPVTAAAMLRLRALPGGLTIVNIAAPETAMETLQSTLHPVGFFRQKGAHLKAMAQKLAASPHRGRVPSTVKELMELPGVGPKVAHLTLVVAFDRSEDGLIVDTHVRRVCERLGWASTNRTPEQTRLAIESWLPKGMWAETSLLLVGFGQQICTPLRPQCRNCAVSTLCPSAFKEEGKAEKKGAKSRAPLKRKKTASLEESSDTGDP